MKNRKPNRKPGYDYSSPGYYFITVCVKNRLPVFGNIEKRRMNLNDYGKIVERQWHWIGEQYKYITLDEFVIMPDHIHGILLIGDDCWDNCRDNPRIVPTIVPTGINPRHNLLSKTINALKTTSSKWIHIAGEPEFRWQRSFHDIIIRDEGDLRNIRNYIKTNPDRG